MRGKVVIVTGGAAGQGLAEARLLAREGASIVVTDLRDSAEDLQRELGDNCLFVQHDVSEKDGWARVIGATLERFGKLDVLVNNAGYFQPSALLDTTDELWDRHYRVNQLGVYLGMKAAAEVMKDAGGSIINVSSLAGMGGTPGIFAYATSKWAVRGMTKLAAAELGAFNIRVNSIYPGAIDTAMLDSNAYVRSEAFLATVPLRRLGSPDDVAPLVRFLASDESSYITGAEITVTGGL